MSENTITCKNNFGETVALPTDKFVFRPSVYGIIRHGNEICICGNKTNNKLWFPGGGVELGEKLKDALVREIREETGLDDVRIGRLLGSFENFFYYQPNDRAMHAFLFFFECWTDETTLNSNEQIDDIEATDIRWTRIDKIHMEDLCDMNEEVFSIISNLIQTPASPL